MRLVAKKVFLENPRAAQIAEISAAATKQQKFVSFGQMTKVQVAAARKIVKFLSMCCRVRKAFETRFFEVLSNSVVKI